MDIYKIVRSGYKKVSPHLPKILTGIGIVLGGAAVISAAKETPRYLELEKERKESGDDSVKAKCKVVAKSYWKTATLYAISSASLIGSNYVSARRQAALSAVCATATEALRSYKGYVAKELGEQKFSELQDKVAQDIIDKTPETTKSSMEICPEDGLYPCYDEWSGRYFWSNEDRIRKVCAEISAEMLVENWVSLNEYYSKPEIGLSSTDAGEALGWNVANDAFVDHNIEPTFSSGSMPDGKPCKVVNFLTPPTTNYKWEY